MAIGRKEASIETWTTADGRELICRARAGVLSEARPLIVARARIPLWAGFSETTARKAFAEELERRGYRVIGA